MSGAPLVRIRHFTDPACPWDFSAERQRLRLAWRYGEQLEWQTRVVVLSEAVPENPPFTTAQLAAGMRGLQQRFGMPIDYREPPRFAATLPACRAIVATRMHAPERLEAFVRALRVGTFARRGLLDEPATMAAAAAAAGIADAELDAWLADPEVETATREDMRAARSPSPAALAQDERLGGPPGERRYTCPSYGFERLADGTSYDLPGFQPIESYEGALANLAPELTARPDPAHVTDVLEWAGTPLGTAEVAAVTGRDATEVRAELAAAGAGFEPVGPDGYWSLP